jgi:prevent-host-death family protein
MRMTRLTIDELKRDPTRFVRHIETGESVLLTRDGKPIAAVKPIAGQAGALRPFGLCAGQFTVPDSFDEPLPDDVLRDFEGR